MKNAYRIAAPMLVAGLIFAVALSCRAQSPFDGTWRINMDESTRPAEPFVYLLQNGVFDCPSCAPGIRVKADGQDHPAPGHLVGHPQYDTISVREIDANTVAFVTKKGGAMVDEQTRTVSGDGNTMIVKTTAYPPNSSQPITAEATEKRVARGPAGANRISGSWKAETVDESENNLLFTYKSDGDELDMSDPTGDSYSAKFDGKQYPFPGSRGNRLVSLRRVDDRTFEETRTRDGVVVLVGKMTVSPDGKKMTIVSTVPQTKTTTTYVAYKQ